MLRLTMLWVWFGGASLGAPEPGVVDYAVEIRDGRVHVEVQATGSSRFRAPELAVITSEQRTADGVRLTAEAPLQAGAWVGAGWELLPQPVRRNQVAKVWLRTTDTALAGSVSAVEGDLLVDVDDLDRIVFCVGCADAGEAVAGGVRIRHFTQGDGPGPQRTAELGAVMGALASWMPPEHPVGELRMYTLYDTEDPRHGSAYSFMGEGHHFALQQRASGVDLDDHLHLGVLAHELTHAWIPFEGVRLGPWFGEGVPNYVSLLALHAAGVHTSEQFQAWLNRDLLEYLTLQAEDPKSEAMPYRRGMMAAWLLDVEIRRATDLEAGLVDVLEQLWKLDGPVTDRAMRRILDEVCRQDMSARYRHLVKRKSLLPFRDVLQGSGFLVAEERPYIRLEPANADELRFLEAVLGAPVP